MHLEFLKTEELAPAVLLEIEAFLDRQGNSHPYQFPGWMGAGESDEHKRKYCAIARERGEIRWFAHCGVTFPASKWLRQVRRLTINRGPACDDEELALRGLRQLLEKSKELGFADVRIAPDWVERQDWCMGEALSQDGWLLLPERRISLRLNLDTGIDELLRSFRHDTKLHIRRSEQQGVAIRLAQDEGDVQEFYRIYFQMATTKKHFFGAEPGHLLHVLKWVLKQKDRGALLLASKDAKPLGGVLVVRASGRAWGVWSANVKESGVTAGHLLQWSAIRWAKEHGCVEYDLGGCSEGINTGPTSFKRGFCRTVVEFSPVYSYPLDRQLCSVIGWVTKARSKWRAA